MSQQRRRAPASSFSSPRGIVWIAAIALVVMFSGLFRVWTRTECVRLGYQIAHDRSGISRLQADQARLRAEVAALKSPIRVTRIARTQLRLGPPTPEQVVVLQARRGPAGPRLARADH
jgi:cell division protein FtsL